ncbi:hypothetical protein PYCCODRAFT_424576 [Trametes coccinea BRFM310]|uniref:Uncharacterized protein n=1 Tax=Trametes coccinea (strain BRFM310) TaxID=1353009 RepID=A0A1Y2IMD6_TRAC3|nr:hypothetical protein PYCCODRAFT_424576 [Trametes coccinea BRFM310]
MKCTCTELLAEIPAKQFSSTSSSGPRDRHSIRYHHVLLDQREPVSDHVLLSRIFVVPSLTLTPWYSSADPSYLAWQQWPFEEELDHWSPKIYLAPKNPAQHWVVLVEDIRVWLHLTSKDASNPSNTVRTKEPSATVNLSGWPFILDTGRFLQSDWDHGIATSESDDALTFSVALLLAVGTACSYFPSSILGNLLKQLKFDTKAIASPSGSRAPWRLPKPPPGKPSCDKGSLIEWTFMSNQTRVKVVTYATRFLRDETGDGLIWPGNLGTISALDGRKHGVLGLVRSHYLSLAELHSVLRETEFLPHRICGISPSQCFWWCSVHSVGQARWTQTQCALARTIVTKS